jgi:hypothetical protein
MEGQNSSMVIKKSKVKALYVLPWCRLDQKYVIGDFELLPYDPLNPSENVDSETARLVGEILRRFIYDNGQPVTKVALIKNHRHDLFDELTEDESVALREAVDLACFSSLARRDFLGRVDRNRLGCADFDKLSEVAALEEFSAFRVYIPGWEDRYANGDTFAPFALPLGDAEDNLLEFRVRARDGIRRRRVYLNSAILAAPPHVSSILKVSLDSTILCALAGLKVQLSTSQSRELGWRDFYDGILCFNEANTDNPAVLWYSEWVNICSAFRRVLTTKYKDDDVSKEFAAMFIPEDPFVPNTNQDTCKDWLEAFHKTRGDLGHGKRTSPRLASLIPARWAPSGSLLMAALAFPLLVRSILWRRGLYKISDYDRCGFAAFLRLLAEFQGREAEPVEDVLMNWRNLIGDEWTRFRQRS